MATALDISAMFHTAGYRLKFKQMNSRDVRELQTAGNRQLNLIFSGGNFGFFGA
jgi:hypothetical protein